MTSYNGNGTAPFVAGSATSQAAAASINNGSAASMRHQVLSVIQATGAHGMTCDEVEQALGLRHQTASARIRELFLSNLLQNSTRRRLTRSRRSAVVWIA